MNHINSIIQSISSVVNGWPLIIFIACVSIVTSFLIAGLQLRAFFKAVKLIIFPRQNDALESQKDMSPLQAFVNTLSTNLGNGSLAGTATALAAGGPGAAGVGARGAAVPRRALGGADAGQPARPAPPGARARRRRLPLGAGQCRAARGGHRDAAGRRGGGREPQLRLTCPSSSTWT